MGETIHGFGAKRRAHLWVEGIVLNRTSGFNLDWIRSYEVFPSYNSS